MTTFQDQPPQSRRSLRQERARAEEIDDSAEAERAPSGRRARAADPEGLVEVSNTEPNGSPEAPKSDGSDDSGAANPDVASSSEARETPVLTDSAIPKAFPFANQVEATSDDAGHPGFRLRDFSPELSTARADSQSASDWTPSNDESVALEYQTQGAPDTGYVSPYAEPTAEAHNEPQTEPSFDSLFSDLLAPEAAVDEDAVDGAVVDDSDAEKADEHDGAVDNSEESPVASESETAVPLGEPVIVDEPEAPVAPVAVAPEERTLSRREWRAMRAAAAAAEANPDEANTDEAKANEAKASEAPAVYDSAPVSEVDVLFQEPEVQQPESVVESTPTGATFIPPLVEPTAAPQSALSDAMAEFEALTRSTAAADARVTDAAADKRAAESRAAENRAASRPETTSAPDMPVPAEQAKAPAADNAPFSFLLNPSATGTIPAAASTDDDNAVYTPPIGHWSRQAELDDENQPFENTLSRDVGGGNVATTTNALVLPMIPQRDDFSSVLNATGEIMVTGTINLPGSVGTTGRDSRHYDDPEVDHLFDAFDNEIPNTDSAPVRAITAVSSHTATRGGIEPGRKQNNRVLTILLVTAGVMAVSVLGLLIAGFVFRIF